MENEISAGMHEITAADESGRIYTTDDVFTLIAGMAAADVEGVAYLAESATKDAIQKSSSKSLSRCIRLEFSENEVTVTLCMAVLFGHTIPAVAQAVQTKVADAITHMIGYAVSAVNVKVVDVIIR